MAEAAPAPAPAPAPAAEAAPSTTTVVQEVVVGYPSKEVVVVDEVVLGLAPGSAATAGYSCNVRPLRMHGRCGRYACLRYACLRYACLVCMSGMGGMGALVCMWHGQGRAWAGACLGMGVHAWECIFVARASRYNQVLRLHLHPSP